MANGTPPNIIMSTGVLYIAPTGTLPPTVDTTNPASPWLLLGTLGAEDYEDSGVKVTNDQKLEFFRGAANTGIRKVSRTEEDYMLGVKLADMSLETQQYAANGNAVTTVNASSGVAGYKRMKNYQGVDVVTFAVLLRTYTPYSTDAAGRMQIWVPCAFQSGKLDTEYGKGKAAMIPLEFTAMRNPTGAIADAYGWTEAYVSAAL